MIDVSSLPSHQQTMRVYIEDTDCGGIVYHANYLKYMERTRTDFLRNYGYEHTQAEQDGFILVVADINIRYKASAKMDDLLTVDVKITQAAKTYLLLEQQVWRQEQLLVSAQVLIGAISVKTGRETKIGAQIFTALAAGSQNSVASEC